MGILIAPFALVAPCLFRPIFPEVFQVLIVMRKEADAEAQDTIKAYLINRGFDIHQSTGANRVIIGVIGDTENLPESDLQAFAGVLQVVRIAKEG